MGRHFQNHMEAAVPVEDLTPMIQAAEVALKELKRAAATGEDLSGGSAYVGVAGVSLLHLQIATQQQRGVEYPGAGPYLRKHGMSHCLHVAEQLLATAEGMMPMLRRVTFLEGYSGILAQEAVVAGLAGDDAGLQRRVQALEQYADAVRALPPGECELLYGRAGYAYSLLWVERSLGRRLFSRALLSELVHHLLQEGQRGAAASTDTAEWGLMYTWHDSRYLGAAHGGGGGHGAVPAGLCGILYVLLHCWGLVQRADASGGAAAAVVAALDSLLGVQFPSGNLPSSLGREKDDLVQWCHGAAGFIPTLCKAHQVLGGGGKYLAAARRASDTLWQRGLLTKGLGLCHGIAGNAYAFLALWRASGEAQQLYRAQQFGLFAAQHWRDLYEQPDRPASLYEGLAGAVALWLDLADPQKSCWPGGEL